MSLSEFGIIERYFSAGALVNPINKLGIGDDCALLQVPENYRLAVTTDTMVEGVHFFAGADPYQLGHKLLAVNLSDLAAMGAEPVAVTLALTLPRADESWLRAFSAGFLQLAERYSIDLIGGDTTSGPLTLTVQAMGIVPQNVDMRRSGAKVGDLVYMTGNLGDAGLGLKIRQGHWCKDSELALRRFDTPEPRVVEGQAIRAIAHACIDLSDGLASDLGHILTQSGVGAQLSWDAIPLSEPVRRYIEATGDWKMPLAAGDDYELCFTVAPEASAEISIQASCIGVIERESGLRLQRAGSVTSLAKMGYEHFSETALRQ